MLAVLQELDSSQSQGLPMLLVWAVRHTSELQVVAPVVEAMARRKGLVLTTHIFFTGERGKGVSCIGSACGCACQSAVCALPT